MVSRLGDGFPVKPPEVRRCQGCGKAFWNAALPPAARVYCCEACPQLGQVNYRPDPEPVQVHTLRALYPDLLARYQWPRRGETARQLAEQGRLAERYAGATVPLGGADGDGLPGPTGAGDPGD